MSKQEVVCQTFSDVVEQLKETFCEHDRQLIIDKVVLAVLELNNTYRPLLDGYYEGEYCKEVYCNIRGYREDAVRILTYTQTVLRETHSCLDDIHEYIHEAVFWIQKAQTLLCVCENNFCTTDSSCVPYTSSSSSDSTSSSSSDSSSCSSSSSSDSSSTSSSCDSSSSSDSSSSYSSSSSCDSNSCD